MSSGFPVICESNFVHNGVQGKGCQASLNGGVTMDDQVLAKRFKRWWDNYIAFILHSGIIYVLSNI
jgi:hypothetical protein